MRVIEALDACRAARVTASVGVIVDDRAELGIVELLARADSKMYGVKQQGKGTAPAAPA